MKKAFILFMGLFSWSHAEIQQVGIEIGGMVCTACVSQVVTALKQADIVAEARDEDFDLQAGSAKITLKENNTISLAELEKNLANAIGNATYTFQSINTITARGTIKKENGNHYFLVSNTSDKIKLPQSKNNKKLSKKRSVSLEAEIKKIDGTWQVSDLSAMKLK